MSVGKDVRTIGTCCADVLICLDTDAAISDIKWLTAKTNLTVIRIEV